VAATLGLAGVRRADLRQIIHERVVERLGIKKVQVFTDAEIALHGIGKSIKAGLVIIAGTGSVCIGQNAKGETFSAGGWGPLAGDEGGGAGIALNALHKIAKASDGRGEATSLSDVAVDYFRAGRIENLSVAIYAPQVDNARIAGFARFVGEKAAVEGDQVAQSRFCAKPGSNSARRRARSSKNSVCSARKCRSAWSAAFSARASSSPIRCFKPFTRSRRKRICSID
jgi:N-acetylglucosamine kinase-like BadF-type ATPase